MRAQADDGAPTPFPQTKEFLPAHALRRILALQTELMKTSQTTAIDRAAITNPSLLPATHPARQAATAQRALLSANFGVGSVSVHGARGAEGVGGAKCE